MHAVFCKSTAVLLLLRGNDVVVNLEKSETHWRNGVVKMRSLQIACGSPSLEQLTICMS